MNEMTSYVKPQVDFVFPFGVFYIEITYQGYLLARIIIPLEKTSFFINMR